jgi:hypothetical protein
VFDTSSIALWAGIFLIDKNCKIPNSIPKTQMIIPIVNKVLWNPVRLGTFRSASEPVVAKTVVNIKISFLIKTLYNSYTIFIEILQIKRNNYSICPKKKLVIKRSKFD